MTRTAWITLGASIAFTSTLVFLVHRQQRVEKEVKEWAMMLVHSIFIIQLWFGLFINQLILL